MNTKQVSNGVLCQARGGKFGDAVYFCRRGRRHYVPSMAHIRSLGLNWPDDLVQVSEDLLDAFVIGSQVPEVTGERAWNRDEIEASSVRMREYLASVFSGVGLEVGAGAAPFPVPLHTRVMYGDKVAYETLTERRYEGQSTEQLVLPDVQTELDTLVGVAEESLDFIVGCHVIEHTRNPIGVFERAHKKLRVGGYLLLVVPDKDRTFDQARQVTTLDHLIEDYRAPSRERDYQHYEEFYRLAFPQPESVRREVVDREFRADGDIHYHVWTYASFMELVHYTDTAVAKWSEIVSHPALDNRDLDIEFYVRLRK